MFLKILNSFSPGSRRCAGETRVKDRRFFLLTSICSVILIFLSLRPFGFIPKLSMIDNNYNDSDIKYILTWTSDSDVKLLGWSYPELNGFKKAGCPEHRCFLTKNRSYLGPASADKFDAILFNPRYEILLSERPTKRDPSQYYIYWNFEAPVWSFFDATDIGALGSFFNWSMGYRMDSTFPVRYGALQQLSPEPDRDNLESFIQKFGEENQHLAVKEGRNSTTGIAAWFVSNCQSFSGREDFVEKLKKNIPVDIYGSTSCSNLRCPDQGDCMGMVNRTYKFYLSLENALCKDYITEKFYKILPYNVIPIVLNAVNMTEIAPPHSYIDIKDFSSLKEFTEFIVRVSEDDALFASFFWWRKFYRVEKCEKEEGKEIFCFPFTEAYCELCAKLHQKPAEKKIITDLKTWVTDSQCRNKEDFFNPFFNGSEKN